MTYPNITDPKTRNELVATICRWRGHIKTAKQEEKQADTEGMKAIHANIATLWKWQIDGFREALEILGK